MADSDRYRGCYYGVVARARAAISGQRGQRHHHAEGRKRRQGSRQDDFERLGVVAPTQDELCHVVLDVTAAIVAGNGSTKRTVGPSARVYTLVEKDTAPHVIGTFEHVLYLSS